MVSGNPAFWRVVEECLVGFHGYAPELATQTVAAFQRRLSTGVSLDDRSIVYHDEPFDIACHLAGVELSRDEHNSAYLRLLGIQHAPGDAIDDVPENASLAQQTPSLIGGQYSVSDDTLIVMIDVYEHLAPGSFLPTESDMIAWLKHWVGADPLASEQIASRILEFLRLGVLQRPAQTSDPEASSVVTRLRRDHPVVKQALDRTGSGREAKPHSRSDAPEPQS